MVRARSVFLTGGLALTFDELITKLEQTPTPLAGSVPTYVQIPIAHAKTLANLHKLQQSVEQLLTEVKIEREQRKTLLEAVQQMCQKRP